MSEPLASAPGTAGAAVDLVEQVLTIWRSVIGADVPIDVDSHLLDVGATSISVVRIRSRVRSELGKELDLIDLLDHPTPREMAVAIAAAPDWEGLQPWQNIDWSAEEEPDGAAGAER
ncbi:acyl carrier protein [Dactylosporangium sp. CA-139066]|uniref:acyl carrier protein n=1 Tax=Dactylosporangium sp. CA-139066 TaxID=3239930 RepID=UPI003D8CC6E9